MKLISKNILNWLKIVINKNKNKNKNKNNLKYIKFIYYNKNNIVINMQRLFKLNSVLLKYNYKFYNTLVLYKLLLQQKHVVFQNSLDDSDSDSDYVIVDKKTIKINDKKIEDDWTEINFQYDLK